jgi:hypothetical protein
MEQHQPPQQEIKTVDDMDFGELAGRIADGKEFSTVAFSKMLEKGVDYWNNKAEEEGPHQDMFRTLAGNYAKALNGGRNERVNFCLEEAAHITSVAEELDSMGERERAETLRERARNWMRMTASFTIAPGDI